MTPKQNELERSAIKAAHPLRTGRHDLYAEAMRLVGERHGKGDLVEMVNWLLYCIEFVQGHAAPLDLQAPSKEQDPK